MSFLDKTYCASPNCTNECGRKMTDEEKKKLDELVWKNPDASNLIWRGYFCGESQQELTNPEETINKIDS